MWRVALAGCLAVVGAAQTALAQCEQDRDTVRCPDAGVEVKRPQGWELSAQASYPGLLVRALHREGAGRLTLAVGTASSEATPRAAADRTRRTLAKVGFDSGAIAHHTTGAALLDSWSADRHLVVRQAFFVRSRRTYVVTLAAHRDVVGGYARAFDDTLRGLVFFPLAEPEAP